MANIVYIATSIDGYIADRDNKLDWLEMIPNPDQNDFGYENLMERIDAVVMGRKTYETVMGFDCEWPYSKPVFVYSQKLKKLPEKLENKVFLVRGTPEEITGDLNRKGYRNLYIDGGKTIQSFLEADLIDEMIISKIPILLGGGTPLFGNLPDHLEFELVSAEVLLAQIASLRYRRKVRG